MTPGLRLFDPHYPLHSLLMHHNMDWEQLKSSRIPVEFASRTMSTTQQYYGQIEKEMLALQLGLLRFHQYVYGQDITVETDYKPLLAILKKPLVEVSHGSRGCIQDVSNTTTRWSTILQRKWWWLTL